MIFRGLDADSFCREHRHFVQFILEWFKSLQTINMDDLVAGDGRHVGVVCVDLIKGFTTRGVLSSPRIAAISPKVADMFRRAYEAGVREFVLLQDSHPEDSLQFEEFGRHCVEGTIESETIDELAALPFADEFKIMTKTTLSPSHGTGLDEWFDSNSQFRNIIMVGDCTDICVYQTALHMETKATYQHRNLSIAVPADLVETYDMSVRDAVVANSMPHDGEFLHVVFLYHMALCGVRVVKDIV